MCDMGMVPLLALKTSQRGSNIESAEPVWKCTIPAFPESIPPTRASVTRPRSSCKYHTHTHTVTNYPIFGLAKRARIYVA
jgi:hypothetical protein